MTADVQKRRFSGGFYMGQKRALIREALHAVIVLPVGDGGRKRFIPGDININPRAAEAGRAGRFPRRKKAWSRRMAADAQGMLTVASGACDLVLSKED